MDSSLDWHSTHSHSDAAGSGSGGTTNGIKRKAHLVWLQVANEVICW